MLNILVFKLMLICIVDAHYLSNLPHTIYEPNLVLQKWNLLEDVFKGFGKSLADDFESTLDDIKSNNVTISNHCSESLSEMVRGMREYRLWAYEMLDATGKLPSGILSFSTSELGSYEQCLRIFAPDKAEIEGQYCLLKFILPLPQKAKALTLGNVFPFENYTFGTEVFEHWKVFARFLYSTAPTLGICVPSLCTKEDIGSIAKFFLKDIPIKPVIERCETNKSQLKTLDKVQILVLSILCLFVLLIVASTIYISWRKPLINESSKSSLFRLEIIESFCVFNNTRSIFDLDSSTDDSLNFLHGIKVISGIWVILCHLFVHFNIDVIRDFVTCEVATRSFFFQIIINGFLSVDSFFFVSGLLVTTLAIKHSETHGTKKFNPLLLIFMRMARLLPSAMIVLGIHLIVPLLSRGPYWNEFFPVYIAGIKNNWWRVITFTNNLITLDKMPMVHYWYIACDVQFFIVAMIFLFIYFKKPSAGIIFGVFLVLLSILTTAGLTYSYDVQPFTSITAFDNSAYFDNIFFHFYPSTHLSCFAVGLITGHIIVKSNNDLKISNLMTTFSWGIALIGGVTSLFGIYWWSNGAPISMLANIIYGSIHRTTWALSLGWLSLMCATGKGGFINAILSSKVLLPLSRLTYLAYLAHFMLVVALWSNFHGVIDGSFTLMTLIFFGVIVSSYIFAFACYVLFDGPIGKLQKIFLKRSV